MCNIQMTESVSFHGSLSRLEELPRFGLIGIQAIYILQGFFCFHFLRTYTRSQKYFQTNCTSISSTTLTKQEVCPFTLLAAIIPILIFCHYWVTARQTQSLKQNFKDLTKKFAKLKKKNTLKIIRKTSTPRR